ncbi:MAG: universal stress protein [Alphaproteobacteria bacterium]|nr:universal stress protein [Alphaproteobacteria bacterium]
MRALVGVDLVDGKGADEVLAQAVGFAEKMGATLDVAYVDGVPYAEALVRDPAVRAMLEAEAKKLRADHEGRVNDMVAAMPDSVRGKAVTRYGYDAADAMVELAADYDLLMVATHGRRGLGHLLLGSVAERIVRLAPVPTLVLRVPKEA